MTTKKELENKIKEMEKIITEQAVIIADQRDTKEQDNKILYECEKANKTLVQGFQKFTMEVRDLQMIVVAMLKVSNSQRDVYSDILNSFSTTIRIEKTWSDLITKINDKIPVAELKKLL